ncbi:MAG: hypothetical protein KME26_16345 [Oscillatoria princeps RMCB-10]|nr:hypothetical protein [Oscillatoria princeps RMCB-10]
MAALTGKEWPPSPAKSGRPHRQRVAALTGKEWLTGPPWPPSPATGGDCPDISVAHPTFFLGLARQDIAGGCLFSPMFRRPCVGGPPVPAFNP